MKVAEKAGRVSRLSRLSIGFESWSLRDATREAAVGSGPASSPRCGGCAVVVQTRWFRHASEPCAESQEKAEWFAFA